MLFRSLISGCSPVIAPPNAAAPPSPPAASLPSPPSSAVGRRHTSYLHRPAGGSRSRHGRPIISDGGSGRGRGCRATCSSHGHPDSSSTPCPVRFILVRPSSRPRRFCLPYYDVPPHLVLLTCRGGERSKRTGTSAQRRKMPAVKLPSEKTEEERYLRRRPRSGAMHPVEYRRTEDMW